MCKALSNVVASNIGKTKSGISLNGSDHFIMTMIRRGGASIRGNISPFIKAPPNATRTTNCNYLQWNCSGCSKKNH